MKILKILGIAACLHALALVLIFANPGCSATKAEGTDAPPITSAPDSGAQAQGQAAIVMPAEPATIRYSPTRPGTAVASALAAQPVSDVTPATAYTVARGDSLWSVAKKNHLQQADLAAANNLKASAVLHVGQKLIIPSKPTRAGEAPAAPEAAPAEQAAAPAAAAAAAGAGDSTRHVVKPGETLGAIARKYGVKQGDIAVANNITDPRKIQPGQELVIPSKSSSSASKRPKAGAPAPAASPDQDLDAGLKPTSAGEVPVIKVDEAPGGQQPKNP
jgi:LysM repeat protein